MNPMSGPGSNDELATQLNRAIFMRESQLAAQTLHQLRQVNPKFCLEGKLQYDLARLLELGNEPELALAAYELVIERSNEAEDFFASSLRAAGHLSYRTKEYQKCREYLERFLMLGVVAPNERTDAETILHKLPDGKGVRDAGAIQHAQQSAQSNQQQFAQEQQSHQQANPPSAPWQTGAAMNDSQSGIIMDNFMEDSNSDVIGKGGQDIHNMPTSDDLRKLPSSNDISNLPTSEDMSYMAQDQPGQPRMNPHNMQGQSPPPPPQQSPGHQNQPPSSYNIGSPDQQRPQQNMNDMMFGNQQQVDDAADDGYSEYSDTPPLKLDSRDLKNPRQSTTKVSKEERAQRDAAMQEHQQMLSGQGRESNDDYMGFEGGMFEVEDNNQHSNEQSMQGVDPIFGGSSVETGNQQETKSRKPVHSNLSPSELLEKYGELTFSALLPVDQKISVDEVVKLLIASEDLTPDDAQRAVVERKGCIRNSLVLEDIVDLYNTSIRFKQDLVFVVDGFKGEDDVRLDATRVDILAPGLRLHTAAGSKKVRWDKIRFVSAGRLNRQPTVDLFVDDDFTHYRLLHGTMDFLTVCPRQDKNFNEACRDFLKEVKRFAPDVYVSHTVRNLLNGRAYRPQKFASNDEFDNYNRSVLLSHFGEEIPIKQIAEAHEAVSSSW